MGGERRVALQGVSWETFLRILDETGDHRRSRIAFNRGVLEIMVPGIGHEEGKKRLDRLVVVVTEEWKIPFKAYGSTTWLRPEAERGIEPDECFYLTREKVAAAQSLRREDVKGYLPFPAPDLAIEIDINPSAVDREEIYATLGVPEVWRFNGLRLAIDSLGDDGVYHSAAASRFLPIRPQDAVRWVLEDIEDDNQWAFAFREWVRQHLVPPPREA